MKTKKCIEFGDFQTSSDLAFSITEFLCRNGISPTSVIEPTCGLGNFLVASIKTFGNNVHYYGFDINAEYVKKTKESLSQFDQVQFEVHCDNFYNKDWESFFKSFTGEILVIGNPPWVTNTALRIIGSENLPQKTNFQNHGGLAAKTGKANFDISEWMLIKLLTSLSGKSATIAMLCKTATARKVLKYGWKKRIDMWCSSLHLIDALHHFGVSVDACLFLTRTGKIIKQRPIAQIYDGLNFSNLINTFGLLNSELVSDIDAYEDLKEIDGIEYRRWRSGVKHDATNIMEFRVNGEHYINGMGEYCDIEPTYLFPLLKSSDIANNRINPSKLVLLTQQSVNDDTAVIKFTAPKTWKYLLSHSNYLDKRASIIYEKRPRFSVFGVGEYTFAPWKVAISGLYKNFSFKVIGSLENKPIVVDDTCYFIPCENEDEANFFCAILNSEIAKRFIKSLVFFDAKRPITIDILRRIDLKKIAEKLGYREKANQYLKMAVFEEGSQQLLVF